MRHTVWIAAILLSLSASCNLCDNREISRVPSPDGKVDAVIFERDCGATTDFSTQISIVTKSSSVRGTEGNTFIGNSNRGGALEQNGAAHLPMSNGSGIGTW
jgi:hypothetical protein